MLHVPTAFIYKLCACTEYYIQFALEIVSKDSNFNKDDMKTK